MADCMPLEAPITDIKDLPLMAPGRPVGRDGLLKDIYAHLRESEAVWLFGVSGAGKTMLAAALAAAYTQQEGGVLWLDGDTDRLAGYVARVGRAYEMDEVITAENPAALVARVRQRLAEEQPFIVIDNVSSPQAAEQFIDRCAHDLPVVLTATDEIDGPWNPLEVGALDEGAAITLFKQKAGIDGAQHDASIADLVRLLAYRPLALVIAARAMVAAKATPDTYLGTLKQVVEPLRGDGPLAALTASYRALNNALQGLLLMLGATYRGEASAAMLSIVSGAPEASLNQATTILGQLYLVERFERCGAPYFRLHPSVHNFAQTWLRGSNRLDALQEKVRQAAVDYVQQYDSGSASDQTRLALEMDNLLAVAKAAADAGERGPANQLAMSLTNAGGFVKDGGYVYELILLRGLGAGSTTPFPAYGPDLAVSDLLDDEDEEDHDKIFSGAARGYEDDDEEYDDENDFDFDDDEDDYEDEDDEEDIGIPADVRYSRNLFDEPPEDLLTPAPPARPAVALDTLPTDQLRSQLSQARQERDTARQREILQILGRRQVNEGKDNEAIATYNDLLTIDEEGGDRARLLETLDMLSALLAKTGNAQAAVMYANRGGDIAQALGDRQTRLSLLSTLGDAHQDLGSSDEAVSAFTQGLEIARMSDDQQHEALLLYKLGYAYLDNGDASAAINAWGQARPIFRDQGKRAYEGRVLGGLGSAYAELERWSEAIGYFKSALHIAREVHDREEEALNLSSLGRAQIEADQLPNALLSYRQALHLAYQSEERDAIVNAILDLVRLMMRSNRLLGISLLLLQDAQGYDPNDRDVRQLEAEVQQKLDAVAARGVQQTPVSGTARAYAANAYALLET